MVRLGRTFAVMLVVTVLAAGAAGWAGVQYGLRHTSHTSDLDATLHDDLDLTAAQNDEIQVLEQKFSADKTVLQQQMLAANRDLARAIIQTHTFGPDAKDAVGRYHQAMGALQERSIEHVLRMRKVLTPQQAAVFDRTVAKALSSSGS